VKVRIKNSAARSYKVNRVHLYQKTSSVYPGGWGIDTPRTDWRNVLLGYALKVGVQSERSSIVQEIRRISLYQTQQESE